MAGTAVAFGACGDGDEPPAGQGPTSDEAVVHLLDAATGEERWTATLPGGWSTAPIVVGDRVLVQVADDCRWSDDTTLVALDASSGETVWTAASATGCGWDVTEPLVAPEGAVVVDGGLRGLDLATGETRWETAGRGSSRPVAVGDSLLLVTFEPEPGIEGLDPATGEVRWSSTELAVGGTLGGDSDLLASLTVVGGPVSRVQVVEADDGTPRWVADVPFHERIAPPVLGPGTVVVTMSEGIVEPGSEAGQPTSSLVATVVAFATEGGHERWRHEYRPSAPGDAGLISPVAVAVDADRVYELRPGVLEAFDIAGGASAWVADVDWSAGSVGAVARVGGHVVALDDGGLVAIDAVTGASRWRYDTSVPAWRIRLGTTDDAVALVEWGGFVEPEGD